MPIKLGQVVSTSRSTRRCSVVSGFKNEGGGKDRYLDLPLVRTKSFGIITSIILISLIRRIFYVRSYMLLPF